MNKGFVGAVLVVLACAGSALAGGEPDGTLRAWVDMDYLLWWMKSMPAPVPLLTTGPFNPAAPTAASGILGNPGTEVLVGGGNSINQGSFSGFRVEAGWVHCSNAFGVEGSYLHFGQQTRDLNFTSDPNGNPLIARPVIDARTRTSTALLVTAPGVVGSAGRADVASTTQLDSADVNLIVPVERECNLDEYDTIHCTWFYLLAGGRYLNLREDLNISQLSNLLPGGIGFFNSVPVVAPSSLGVVDNFHTINEFYGGQVGAQAGFEWWRFSLSATGKVALGTMREIATITGSSVLNDFTGTSRTVPGGLLALQSNMGNHARNMFAVVPEGTLNLTFEITAQLKVTVGYTFLYVSNVARPGDQIDPAVNRTLIPTSQAYHPDLTVPTRPAFLFSGSDFWAQGINIGLGLRF